MLKFVMIAKKNGNANSIHVFCFLVLTLLQDIAKLFTQKSIPYIATRSDKKILLRWQKK